MPCHWQQPLEHLIWPELYSVIVMHSWRCMARPQATLSLRQRNDAEVAGGIAVPGFLPTRCVIACQYYVCDTPRAVLLQINGVTPLLPLLRPYTSAVSVVAAVAGQCQYDSVFSPVLVSACMTQVAVQQALLELSPDQSYVYDLPLSPVHEVYLHPPGALGSALTRVSSEFAAPRRVVDGSLIAQAVRVSSISRSFDASNAIPTNTSGSVRGACPHRYPLLFIVFSLSRHSSIHLVGTVQLRYRPSFYIEHVYACSSSRNQWALRFARNMRCACSWVTWTPRSLTRAPSWSSQVNLLKLY
ncbi:hypothetical protein LXA43DRAFT_386955 [Ganoderma leucocontextum]|nr:hypothetical protein LXA43DRAFT_386955 [Ganoderma leucocontextum]